MKSNVVRIRSHDPVSAGHMTRGQVGGRVLVAQRGGRHVQPAVPLLARAEQEGQTCWRCLTMIRMERENSEEAA